MWHNGYTTITATVDGYIKLPIVGEVYEPQQGIYYQVIIQVGSEKLTYKNIFSSGMGNGWLIHGEEWVSDIGKFMDNHKHIGKLYNGWFKKELILK